eukprot:scaffold431_cov334-Pavlova_lutheri.AAC.30
MALCIAEKHAPGGRKYRDGKDDRFSPRVGYSKDKPRLLSRSSSTGMRLTERTSMRWLAYVGSPSGRDAGSESPDFSAVALTSASVPTS